MYAEHSGMRLWKKSTEVFFYCVACEVAKFDKTKNSFNPGTLRQYEGVFDLMWDLLVRI